MMIGYTQLMKDVFNVDKASAEIMLATLTKHKPSDLRMKALRKLARMEEDTISGILKAAGENNTGGTYKTVHNFFVSLAEDNILIVEKRGQREYWRFAEKALHLQRYLEHSAPQIGI